MTEKIGKMVSVTRIDLEEEVGVEKKIPSITINSKWRKVGDNSLYSVAKFNVFRVYDIDPKKPKIDEPYILVILSPGMSYFESVRLNFKQRSIGYFVDVQMSTKTPIFFIKCRGAKLTDFADDKSLENVKTMDEPVLCFAGGTGIKF